MSEPAKYAIWRWENLQKTYDWLVASIFLCRSSKYESHFESRISQAVAYHAGYSFQFSATIHLYSWDSWGFSCDWINQSSDTGAIKKIYHDHLVLARHSWLLANTAGSRVEGRKTRGVLEKECVHHRGRKNLQSLSSLVDLPGRVHQAINNSKQHLPQPPVAAQQIFRGPVAPIWSNHVQSLIPTHPHDSEESATMKRTGIFAYNHIWLVVLTILKNMKVNGKDYPIYIIYIYNI